MERVIYFKVLILILSFPLFSLSQSYEIKGIITDVNAYYPFWIWQLVICLPLAVVLFRWLKKSPKVWRLIICYGVFTLVFWYFSRYFNNSHLGYLSIVFLTAYFWGEGDG